MYIDSLFIAYATNIFISIFASLAFLCGVLYVHGTHDLEERAPYSAYLRLCEKHMTHHYLGIAGIISALALLLFTVIFLDTPTEKIHRGVGIGVFVYAFAFLFALYVRLYASIRERRDVKGVHRHLVRSQRALIFGEMERVTKMDHYHGKTKLQVASVHASLQDIQLLVQEESKIRKNTANLHRSIHRFQEIQSQMAGVKRQIKQLHQEIAGIYDSYYEIEADLLQKRQEDAKKQLNVTKEMLDTDPFGARPMLRHLKERQNKQLQPS